MSSGSRVSIPNNVRKTIQDIKEIAGNHSDDDIYAMLKECNMDPNETAQRLLYLDTFHEVKRKRDRRKVNVRSWASEESRWTTGQGARSGLGNYSSSVSHGAGSGRNVNARKENGVSNRMERGFKPSLSVPEKTENDAGSHFTNSTTISVNGPISGSDGCSSHECGTRLSAGVHSFASDPVMLPPLSSRIPAVGAIKREVRQLIAAESGSFNQTGNSSSTAHDVANNIQAALGDLSPTKEMLKEPPTVENNKPLEPYETSSLTTSFGSLEVISIQDGRSSQQLNGPSKGSQDGEEDRWGY